MTWMNQLYYGDNLRVLRDDVRGETVDLVYLDPPFNSAANYAGFYNSQWGNFPRLQILTIEDLLNGKTPRSIHASTPPPSNAPSANVVHKASRAGFSLSSNLADIK